jgi:hypothetical protein
MFTIGVRTNASLGMIVNENPGSLHKVIVGSNQDFDTDPAKLITS